MIDSSNIDIYKISLQAAIACNLQCEYCLVSKNANNPNLKELQDNTNQAILDGTYLQNILFSLKRLKQSPQQITELEIWGQEPTLVLPYLTEVFSDWYNAFYNLNEMMFSTNALTLNFDEIVFDFIQSIDNVLDKPLTLTIQISYDGIGEKIARGGNSFTIKENLIKLYERLNKIKFKNIKVEVVLHAVLSTQLINILIKDFKKIEEFFEDIENFYIDVMGHILNGGVRQGPLTLQYMNGSFASLEEGLNYALCADMMERFLITYKEKSFYFKNFPLDIDAGANTLGCVVHKMPGLIRRAGYNTLREFVNAFIEGDPRIRYTDITEYCGAITYDLKIMYDGTNTTCQNYIFDAYTEIHNKNNKEYKNTITDQAIKYAMKNTQAVNLVTGTDEEIMKQLNWSNKTIKQNNLLAMTNMVANQMFMMAQVGQLSSSYLRDLEKLKTHAFVIATLECCYYNLMITTGSVFIHPSAQIRLICNGVMDRVEDMINTVLKRKGEIPE